MYIIDCVSIAYRWYVCLQWNSYKSGGGFCRLYMPNWGKLDSAGIRLLIWKQQMGLVPSKVTEQIAGPVVIACTSSAGRLHSMLTAKVYSGPLANDDFYWRPYRGLFITVLTIWSAISGGYSKSQAVNALRSALAVSAHCLAVEDLSMNESLTYCRRFSSSYGLCVIPHTNLP